MQTEVFQGGACAFMHTAGLWWQDAGGSGGDGRAQYAGV